MTDVVELVDEGGVAVGRAGKLAAHRAPGQWHRAFSVFLFDGEGRLLLQRRALGKYHSPGVWSNTCCGHPAPGEEPVVAAARRVGEELGVTALELTGVGTVRYDLADPQSGLVEREHNHVFVGWVGGPPAPDPAEVAETVFVTTAELRALRQREAFSVWFDVVAGLAL